MAMRTPHDVEAYFSDDHPEILDELTYKDIFKHVNPLDLPHRDYAPLIPYVKYDSTKHDTMKFFVPNKHNGFNVYVQFDDWDAQVEDTRLTAVEAARVILWGANLKMHCECPAFLYWGSEYILTQLDAAIVPETRYPHIRNPFLKGILCKHGRRTIKVLPFHVGDMAKEIKKQRSHLR